MKQLARIILMGILSLAFCTVQAQFLGGQGDGQALALGSNLSLGRNIYLGGQDDGHALALGSNLAMGRNIYLGGQDDGHAMFSASNLPMGRNIYLGGQDDGHALALASNLSLGRNIYLGGQDDGYASVTASNLPLGRNIYLGGGNDGWAMALGTQVTIIPLPVTLLSFTGKWDGVDALLEWKTSLEYNTERFELERSFDGLSFSTAGTVPAAGQSTDLRTYRYADPSIRTRLPQNSVYYRLKTVDIDASTSYSGVVILTTDRGQTIQYTLFPNPARDRITVSASVLTDRTSIQVTDAAGRVVLRQAMTNRQESIAVSSLAAGAYFLQLTANGQVLYTQKLIISK